MRQNQLNTFILCLSVALLGVGVFGRGDAFYHPTAIAPYHFVKTIIRLRFNLSQKIVFGDEVVVVRPKHGGLQTLPFDSAGIEYQRVTVNGRIAPYRVDRQQQRVNVQIPRPSSTSEPLAIEFLYRTRPQRGLVFVEPDASYPKLTPEIWTQGEAVDNRRWFPTWDEPNEKTPSELIVTVPRSWTVVANGSLRSHRTSNRTETWDWVDPIPKSTYLIAFAAGPLVKHHTSRGSLDVDSFVQPPYAALNAICFGDTNKMIAYFDSIFSAYPFLKYDQTTAERYDFGGMEDESATLISTKFLHAAIADSEDTCDPVVSHELAQHWWGDDVTMSDWSNIWINEGFATYGDELWTGHRYGEAAFEYARYQAQQRYFDETQDYLRPIVDYVYADPIDLFDASGHERPAEILHMLRTMYGDERFFGALRSYLHEYQFRNADTHEFFVSIGKALHTDLTWFERQWFYRRDYPHFVVSDRYDTKSQRLTLDVKQRNIDGNPYRIPLDVQVFFGGRNVVRHIVSVSNAQTFVFDGITSDPQMVLFDPNANVLKQLTFDEPVAELAYQLANAPHVGDREWALAQLAGFTKAPSPDRTAAARAVARAVSSDTFYGVRADAVAIAAAYSDAATVYRAFHDRDVRVRIAAVQAAPQLGAASGSPVLTALRAMVSDQDPNVAAAALTSLGSLKTGDAYDRLVAALDRPSFGQTIAIGAIRGLTALGDKRALLLIEARTAYGVPDQERKAAIVALAQLARSTNEASAALPILRNLVERDPVSGARIAAARALGILNDPAALPILESVKRTDSQVLVQISARDAIANLERTSH